MVPKCGDSNRGKVVTLILGATQGTGGQPRRKLSYVCFDDVASRENLACE